MCSLKHIRHSWTDKDIAIFWTLWNQSGICGKYIIVCYLGSYNQLCLSVTTINGNFKNIGDYIVIKHLQAILTTHKNFLFCTLNTLYKLLFGWKFISTCTVYVVHNVSWGMHVGYALLKVLVVWCIQWRLYSSCLYYMYVNIKS